MYCKKINCPPTCVDDLSLEELHRVVDVGQLLALLAQEEGQLDVLRVAGAAPDGKELWPDELSVELHDLVDPSVADG